MEKEFSVSGSIVLTVLLLITCANCSEAPMSAATGGQDPADQLAEEDLASKSCTTDQLNELEQRMRSSLQNVATDHSFYVELQRPLLDGRKFTFTRNIDGPIDENATLQSASTAKLISAAVILDVISNPQLYPGRGLLNGKQFNLDSLARDFLADGNGGTFWRTNTGALPTSSRLHSVTLRHLLSFTSGLELEAPAGTKTKSCISSDQSDFTHGACVRNLVTLNLSRNLNSTEQRTFFYNGAHLNVAALMAVKAAGVANWAELFKTFKRVHGVFEGTVSPSAPVADFGPGAYFPFSNGNSSPSPAGALRYRAGDYASFLSKLYLAQILSPALLNQMFSDQITQVGAGTEYSPVIKDSEEWHYGLGLWTECSAPVWTSTCGVSRFSSPGSFGSYPFIDLNYTGSQSAPLIGFVGRGGSDLATAIKGIEIYRSMGDGSAAKDLAQLWAANQCP